MRTVAMLINEAADALHYGIADAAGIDAACLGGIKELIARSEAQWPGLKLYVIGGDRAYFTTELGLKNGPDNFTLLGLQAASAEV